MKRRHFCQNLALGSLGFAGVAAGHSQLAMGNELPPHRACHRWVILYWMPYDNDLVRFGEPIIEMLANGSEGRDVAVAIQSDYWADAQMRRRTIINGVVQELTITVEDSSDPAAFADYLDWAYETFEADHWAVFVVGHGGKINEISPDDHRVTRQPRTWMGVDQFADIVSRFNQMVGERVELLFFQNCNKGTLEVVYEARNCARYTLASQLTLGAPNFYYEGLLARLEDPTVDGREVAIAIMESERLDMYHTLTLVDNRAVQEIPPKLSQVITVLLEDSLPAIAQLDLQTYHYFSEQHCDALALLIALSEASGRSQAEVTAFSEFLQSSVITHTQTGGTLFGRSVRRRARLGPLCGLSLYLPETEQAISRYQSLDLSQSVDVIGLYQALMEAI